MKKELKNILLIYFITWVVLFCILSILFSRGETTFLEGMDFFIRLVPNPKFLIAIHVVFGFVLSLFWVIRYFVRIYKKKDAKTALKQFSIRILAPLAIIIITFKSLVFANINENYSFDWNDAFMNNTGKTYNHYLKDKMHRGMSVFGWRGQENKESIDALIKANVEWVAVIPFIGQEDETSKTVRRPITKDAPWTRRDSTFIHVIKDLHAKNLHVQLKPHLWTFNGWRSNLSYTTKEDWDTWFDSYENYMLRYAQMAELTKVELLCIGTELKTSIKNQPERWKQLITKIKTIYSGQLTYAANWHDEFEDISFWADVDYIGVQAYFPLTKDKNPDLETIKKGWDSHILKLEQFSKIHDKPILFTEVGYRSDVSATIKPWEWNETLSSLFKKKSDKTQQLAYEALFQKLWHKEWFAGVYIWQWDHRSTKEESLENLDFSPRFKPAENTLAKWYGK